MFKDEDLANIREALEYLQESELTSFLEYLFDIAEFKKYDAITVLQIGMERPEIRHIYKTATLALNSLNS